jgi:RNA polymerase sigma-70 factor (ECF subfamily)
MVSADSGNAAASRNPAQFATTHWSTVLAAGDSAVPGSREALERLCRACWYPLYAFVRGLGKAPEDAQDLTQAFFERLLEKHYLKDVAREQGRFRCFLITAFKRFLCDQYDRATAAKRGGRFGVQPLAPAEAEHRWHETASLSNGPEESFDRAWAEELLRASISRLREECETAHKGAQFEQLKVFLSRPAQRTDYARVGERLGMSPDAVAMAVVRLRRQFRALMRAEIANTVATPAEIDDEMRYLVNLLTR